MTAYPQLEALLGGWFHQDYDLGGSDIPDIVANACATLAPGEVAELAREIRSYLEQAGPDLDAAVARDFAPDLDPGAWDMDARTWLEWILREVERAAAGASRPPSHGRAP